MPKLTVDKAAIKIGNLVFSLPRPNRHHNVMWMLYAMGIKSELRVGNIQGFVCSDGTFVNRKEAVPIAIAAGQITAPSHPPDLYSEDLFDGGMRNEDGSWLENPEQLVEYMNREYEEFVKYVEAQKAQM